MRHIGVAYGSDELLKLKLLAEPIRIKWRQEPQQFLFKTEDFSVIFSNFFKNYYFSARCTEAHLKAFGSARIFGFSPTYFLASSNASSKVRLVFIPIPLAYPGS